MLLFASFFFDNFMFLAIDQWSRLISRKLIQSCIIGQPTIILIFQNINVRKKSFILATFTTTYFINKFYTNKF